MQYRHIYNPALHHRSGLSKPLSVTEGGTGSTTPEQAVLALNALSKSLSGQANHTVPIDDTTHIPMSHIPTDAYGIATLGTDNQLLDPISPPTMDSVEISVSGTDMIVGDIDYTFTITNYDDFSTYSVSVNQGTISILNDTISYKLLPSEYLYSITEITIKRNDGERIIRIPTYKEYLERSTSYNVTTNYDRVTVAATSTSHMTSKTTSEPHQTWYFGKWTNMGTRYNTTTSYITSDVKATDVVTNVNTELTLSRTTQYIP